MKTLGDIEKAIMVLVVFGILYVLVTKPASLWNLFKHKEKIENVKKIKVDPQKIGKKVGDFKRKFMKGFNDTTTIKTDTVTH